MASVLLSVCLPASGDNAPGLEFKPALLDGRVVVTADLFDRDGDLASATLYVVDEPSAIVIWTEHRIVTGKQARLNFSWPLQSWRAGNGTESVGPVLVVNTIDLPPDEAPYKVFSAPAVLRRNPLSRDLISLAYFDQSGDFHSLTDLEGNTYYKSRELLGAVDPQASFGAYVRDNLSLRVGETSLSFFRFYLNRSLVPYPPLVLQRSPIHHYTVSLQRQDVRPGRYLFQLEVEDSRQNKSNEIMMLQV